MKVSRDQITGAVTVLLGIFVFVMISQFSVPFTAEYPGPKALPALAGIGFIICGAGIFLEGCRKTEEKTFLVKEGWIRLIINLVLIAVYILAMKYIGFMIATPILLFVLSTWYAKGYKSTVVQRIIFAVAVTAVVYLAYHVAFGYSMPDGLLFG